MSFSSVSRRTFGRAFSTLVAVTLAVTAAGIVATSASADAETPQHVEAVSTTDASNDGTVLVTWDAPLDQSDMAYVDVSLTGRTNQQTDPDFQEGAVFYPVPADGAPLTATVLFVYNDDSHSTPADAMVTVEPVPAPDAVTAVSGRVTGADLVVSWHPAAGGAPYDHYLVTVDGRDPVVAAHGTAEAMFTGIAPGSYGVIVAAVNARFSTPAQSTVVVPAAPTPQSPASAPSRPTQPQVSHLKHGGVATVSWKAPAGIDGAPVTGYVVHVDGRRHVVGPHATSLTVKGLRAGPARVLAQAVNKNGISTAVVTTVRIPKSVAAQPKATLRFGMHGPAVKRLQIALQTAHHTGVFTKVTRQAVKQWQKAYGRHVTGVVNDRARFLLAV
jgi:Putative peptidoglycan binding domain